MKRIFNLTLILLIVGHANGQTADSISTTNKDAVYQRPFVLEGERGGLTAAVGGYLEANTNYFVTDGVGEGFSMEMRRFNIFLYSTIQERIRFLSELEFEHGTEEIALETAMLDFVVHPSLVFRAGIVLVPLGYFNQNHDSPKWEFIDRPLVSTTLIPATYSDVGFGLHGKIPIGDLAFTYETYLLNGLQDGIVANLDNRTFTPGGKNDGRFRADNNGSPSLAARIAFNKRGIGELGLSSFGGYYNTFKKDGLTFDEKRKVLVFALDYNFKVEKLQIIGEAAMVKTDVPPDLGPHFGKTQWGLHTDLLYPIAKMKLFNWEGILLNLAVRFEYVDYNVGEFEETGGKIYDHATAIVPGIGLRFSPNTLLRMNYRYQWDRDLLGNPVVKTAGFQFGMASYF